MRTVPNNEYAPKVGASVISGKSDANKRQATRIAYERKEVKSVRRSFFPAAPFDAQSLAGTGALVFEGEMIGGGN